MAIRNCLQVLRLSKKLLRGGIIQIHVIRHTHSQSSFQIMSERTNIIRSSVIYPKKHLNHSKSLSLKQMQFYRNAINGIQQCLQTKQIPPNSPIDLNVLLGSHSVHDLQFTDKQIIELKKWLQKMPHIKILQSDRNHCIVSRDHHIDSVDFISHSYPMVTWKNRVHFKTHSRGRRNSQNANNTVHRIKELINYYQLHSVFPDHSIEAKMIFSRGLNHKLTTAYNHLIANRIDQLTVNDYHHLVGNLGLNILSYFSNILCENDNQVMNLHHDLTNNKILTVNDLQHKYNPSLDVATYETLCQFLVEYYSSYFANRKEYKQVIDGATQRMSHLDVMPFLFEMKTLVKIGMLLDYINKYYSRLIYAKYNRLNEYENDYYFNIHHNKQKGKTQKNKKQYRVFSEKQLENGDCSFSVERCTPDIVLSEPIWINNKPIYWFDAKCTKATNCLYDKKRHYQMYRFTKNYGNGAILALGSADLSIVGINDVIILDCSHYL